MPKLHEILAVESQLKGQAQQTRTDLRATFDKKEHLFSEKRVTFVPSEEGAETVTEHQSALQTIVAKELDWIAALWTKALNVSLAVADGNTLAKADIVLDDGTVLLAAVPATALLELEKRAAEVQELVASVKTLDPAKGFQADPERGEGVYQARQTVTVRTRKTARPIVLYPATTEHPAQTQLITEDVVIGHWDTVKQSGALPVRRKADVLERIEKLIKAAKFAREEANAQEAPDTRVGGALFDFIFAPS